MTTEQKIDELLRIVQGHDARFSSLDVRFEQVDARFNQIDARFEKIDARFEKIDSRLKEQEERDEVRERINNARFEHLSRGIDGLRIEMREVKEGVIKMNTDLNAKIDHTYNSLSQDINAFAGDLHDLDRRVTRLEKKSLS